MGTFCQKGQLLSICINWSGSKIITAFMLLILFALIALLSYLLLFPSLAPVTITFIFSLLNLNIDIGDSSLLFSLSHFYSFESKGIPLPFPQVAQQKISTRRTQLKLWVTLCTNLLCTFSHSLSHLPHLFFTASIPSHPQHIITMITV